MSQLIKINPAPDFDYIYENYSASLYGIILKICPNAKVAEEILIASFRTFFHHTVTPQHNDLIFPQLLRITIRIAAEKTNIPKQKLGKIILKDLKSLGLTKAV